jgi:predicted esterase YcpF (UPF0227 family)
VSDDRLSESADESRQQEQAAIIAAHMHCVDGVEVLEFRSKAPRRVLIGFSCMRENSFDRWSWYWPEHCAGSDVTFLLFRDNTFRYFLGDETTPYALRVRRYIDRVLADSSLCAKDCVSVGSSMGGYAAAYYGFWMGFRGVIAVNPQVDQASAQMHNYDLWDRKMREAGPRWIDLDRHVFRHPHRPMVFLRHGRYPADESAANALVRALERRRVPYIREFDDSEEHGFAGIDKRRLGKIVDFMHEGSLLP